MYTKSPTRQQRHLISSCLQLSAAFSIKYSMVLSNRYSDASVVAKYTQLRTVIDVTLYIIHRIFDW